MQTSSIAFPNMFDVSHNTVGVYEDNQSVVNRNRLLFLTNPTELYNNPTFGVGLAKHLWKYNVDATKKIIQDEIIDQLRLYEPAVVAEETSFADGLLFTGESAGPLSANYNELKFTVGLVTVYGDNIEVNEGV